MTQNPYFPVFVVGKNSLNVLCGCSTTANFECITCECSICHICKPQHSDHYLQSLEDWCPEHNKDLIFFCEQDLVPLCESCLEWHLESKHKVWHRDQIIKQFWGTINDIEENRKKMIKASKKISGIEGNYRVLNLKFQKILGTEVKVWYEQVKQAFEVGSFEYPQNQELEPFIHESAPITQSILMHITTYPARPDDSETLVYVTRGSSEMFMYNFASNSFSILKITEKILKWSGIVLYSPFQLLVTGGKPSKNQGSTACCFSINIKTGDLDPFPDMPTSHSSHVCLQYNSQIYVLSGKNNVNGISTCCERLDLASRNWQTLRNNIIGRTCAAGVVHKEKIFIIGGCKNNSVEKYSIVKDQWKLLSFKLFDVVWQHLAISTGERVLVFGGDSVYDTPSRYSYLLDTKSGEVSQLEVIPVGQCWLCGWYPYIIRGNRLWVMNKELKFLSYNLDTQQWSSFRNKLRKTK